MVDNLSMESPTQFTQNTMESTTAPTQGATFTQNITDKNTKNNYKGENGGERGYDDGYDCISSPNNLDDSDGDIGPSFDQVFYFKNKFNTTQRR